MAHASRATLRPSLVLAALLSAAPTLLPPARGQCAPLSKEVPRSSTLRCTPDQPCTRFRVATGRGGGGTGVNCDHGCATEFIPVGDCSARVIVTDDLQPGKWVSCNGTAATLEIYPPEPYPPTCSGKPVKTMTFRTDAVCRELATPVADGPYWQMDCMNHYDPWIPPQLLAIGVDHERDPIAVTVSAINTTKRTVTQLYRYNQSLGAVPQAAVPAAPNNGKLYFAAFADSPRNGSRVVSYEPRSTHGDWRFPSSREQPFLIHALGFYRPSSHGCDYEDPRCGVYILADHGDHMDVGEILSTGDYNVTSARFPDGVLTGVSAFNKNVGTFFFLQMETNATSAAPGYRLVACTLPDGTLTSVDVDPRYRVLALEFDQQRSTLVGVFERLPALQPIANLWQRTPETPPRIGGKLYGGTLDTNGTVTTAGHPITPSDPSATFVGGVAAFDGASLHVLYERSAGTGRAYEVASVDPWTGHVQLSGPLQQQHPATQVVELTFA